MVPLFFILRRLEKLQINPWGIHDFWHIFLQLFFIVAPIISLFISFSIEEIKFKVLKLLMIILSLVCIYYTTLPLIFSWIGYFTR